MANLTHLLPSLLAVLLMAQPLFADRREPCKTAEFKTQMYKEACATGGQAAAKQAAKKFMKDSNIQSCMQCHTKLAPNYQLKPDALEQFKRVGGKVLDAKPAAKPLPATKPTLPGNTKKIPPPT